LGKLADAAALTLFAADEALQPHLIPVEINLEGWPLFSRRKSPESGAFEVGQSIGTDDGRRLEQVWRVTASADFSLPGPFDEDVFVGVMALVRQRGGMPKDGKIRFSLYELIKALGKSKRGGFHEKVRESLDRIASTIYYSKNAFYVLEDESLETYRFTLWTVHFSSAKGTDGRAAEHHTLKFDDIIIRSYNAGYLKLLDTDLYFRLKIPLAKALYRLVDQRRCGSSSWSVNIRQLRDLLVMSKSYKAPSRIWEVLAPAHRALKREKFLESATIDGGVVRYRIHADFARDRYPDDAEPAAPLREEAVAALAKHGMWPNRARALVDRFGPEKAFHALDILKVRGNVENRGAYVAEVIEHGDPDELAEVARFLAAEQGQEDDDPGAQLGLISDAELGPRAESPSPPPPPVADPRAQELWDEVLEDVANEINTPSLRVWFEATVPVALADETLTLAVPNAFAQEYIESRFKETIERSLKERLSENASLSTGVAATAATR
jgi:Replication initiator protein A/DnaA N-terminal domain